jgi:hypothetical protein
MALLRLAINSWDAIGFSLMVVGGWFLSSVIRPVQNEKCKMALLRLAISSWDAIGAVSDGR